MDSSTYLVIFMVIFFVIYYENKRKKEVVLKNIILNKKNKSKERIEMEEMVKRFIDKECLIYTFNSQLTGTVKEVTDGAILLDNGKETEIINLDFIVRIREVPKNKKGKKKSVVLD